MKDEIGEACAQIGKIASDILEGRTSFIEGSRLLLPFIRIAGMEWDPPCTVFIAIESETDTLPMGKVRDLWAPEALQRLDLEEAERWAREHGTEACRVLATRWKPNV